jgi:PTS system cellobiose-specific IIA component
MDDELTKDAMQIILHAGDARNEATYAIDACLQGNQVEADKHMEQALDDIKQAHNTQTSLISAEAAGNGPKLSLLFIHAQDTLMTIMSEINMTKSMIKMYRKIQEAK